MKRTMISSCTIMCLFTLALFSQSFTKNNGGDYYKITLNDRIIFEHYVTMPVTTRSISLTAANKNDRLGVSYSHCGKTGKERKVFVKDAQGKILKQWKFTDVTDRDLHIGVKDILGLSAKGSSLQVFYSSKELPAGKWLINLSLPNQSVAGL